MKNKESAIDKDENLEIQEDSIDTAQEETKSELQVIEEKYDQLNDTYLRLVAEFDNYRKRTLREKTELLKTAGEGILVNILPLIDDFERAIKVIETAEEIEPIKEGVDLIYSKFVSFLTQNGVKAIDTENVNFDEEKHEAVTTIPAPSKEMKGMVVDCVSKGYVLHDKVIRFPKVVVGE